LSSRILLRPGDLDRSHRFYRDILGLAIYREFGPPDEPRLVFFLGQGLLEVSGHAAGVPVVWEPVAEPWGLIEMWIGVSLLPDPELVDQDAPQGVELVVADPL